LFYTDKLKYNNMFKSHLYGLGLKFKYLLLKRLELTTFTFFFTDIFFLVKYSKTFYKNVVKTINIIFSQLNNVNYTILEFKKLNIIRKYLTKSYQGYCHAVGKPVRGQRTWSNGWNSFKCNNLLRSFVNQIKQAQSFSNKSGVSKNYYKVIQKKYTQTRTNKGLTINTASINVFRKNNFLGKKSWY